MTSEHYYLQAEKFLRERDGKACTYENIFKLAALSGEDFRMSCQLKAADRIANALEQLAEAVEILKDSVE